MGYLEPEPCDECYQRPAVRDGLCYECWAALRREHEPDDYYEDDEPDDAASDRAQTAWENWFHGGK